MKFTLHKFIRGNIERTCQISNPRGTGYTNAQYIFSPGEVYNTDDPVFMAYIAFKGVGDVRERSLSTPELRETLEAYNVPYESRTCASCQGAKPFLWYNPFRILTKEEEEEYENAK